MPALINSYTIKSIDNIVCLPGTGILRLVMTVDTDLSSFLPYINGYVKKCRYLPQINWIRFSFHGFPEKKGNWNVAIKGKEIIVAKFSDSEEAKGVAREVINLLNHIHNIKGEITPDYTPWRPPKVFDILTFLPKTNCKKCGYHSCMAFATKLAEGEAEIDDCPELIKGSEKFEKLCSLFERKSL